MQTSRTSTSDEVNTYKPKSSSKTVFIQRGGGTVMRNRNSMYGMGPGSSMSMRMSGGFSPAVYSQMAGSGIADFRGTREKEKREMQDCNERLATYIEKVRWLEAQNKRLELENEALRQRKQEDWRPIRDMFESELTQAREVIKDLSTQKGVSEAKLAGLQDEIESLRDLITTHEGNAKDYAKKIDQLNAQIGEYEGELNTLRLRCGSLEDEAAKLRALVNKYKEENARLRADLDAETAAHIEQEVLAQTRLEEIEFLQELLEQLNLTQQEPVTVKGMDMEAFFKGELRSAIQSMQQTYDDKLSQMTIDCEAKVASQVNQLRSGNVRDTMEAENAKAEVKRVRDLLADKSGRLAALEGELGQLRADKMRLSAENSDLSLRLDQANSEFARRTAELQQNIEALMAQLHELIDAKMSLELEIACYKKLLEGEENRTGLRQLVEQTIGIRGDGAGQLAGLISGSHSSSGTGGASGSMTTRMEIQKNRTGMVGIRSADQAGTCIELEVDGGARSAQDLKSMKLIRRANNKETMTVDLSQCDLSRLEPGKVLKIWASGAKKQPDSQYDFIVRDQYNFGMGESDFLLYDGVREVSTLRMRQTH